jgi:hypothetical protein
VAQGIKTNGKHFTVTSCPDYLPRLAVPAKFGIGIDAFTGVDTGTLRIDLVLFYHRTFRAYIIIHASHLFSFFLYRWGPGERGGVKAAPLQEVYRSEAQLSLNITAMY